MNAQRFAVASVAGATLIVSGANMARGNLPNVRVFIGGTVAAFALAVAAGPVPAVVRALSVLIILGAVLTSGYDLARPLATAVRG